MRKVLKLLALLVFVATVSAATSLYALRSHDNPQTPQYLFASKSGGAASLTRLARPIPATAPDAGR